ncbi:MAG: ABC transporter permease [Ruminococcaceae bacterium]|nr:ABC transporter permease [Oscillospiraceae bacterium]
MDRTNTDVLKIELTDEAGTLLFSEEVNTADPSRVQNNAQLVITPRESIENAKGKTYTLTVTSLHGVSGNAVTFYYGNTVNAGRANVAVDVSEKDALYVNGSIKTDEANLFCSLCLTVAGNNLHLFGSIYWYVYAGAALLFGLLLVYLAYCHLKEKKNAILEILYSFKRYRFLTKQLVARDFKTKYKRSVLGVLWSFLNPLLTMSIQYVVFSTIFKSDIPNFSIYLLSGIICFNFFNEATNMCLMSIVGNATLINKVYVPKYIYPFSRTLSSSINLLLSLVPLLIMLLITRTPITLAILLLPFVLLMLFLFSYGVGLILAALMVFFRDTQFLWGIVSMLLMYLTPVFYPESIIPDRFMSVYRLNPMYQILRFIRSILVDGKSPEPMSYLYCILLCGVPLLIGILVFRKSQNKFIFNL